jgi:hypothetical protein
VPGSTTLPVAAFEARPTRHALKGRFYVGSAVFVILLNAAGFLPSLIDQSRRLAAPTWLVAVHGATASAWLLLFLAQTILAATRRTAWHRRLGVVGPFLVVAIVVSGYLVQVDMIRRGHDLSGDLLRAAPPASQAPSAEEFAAQMLPALQAFANFALLAGVGLWFRHSPEIHKRLMLLALGQLVVTPMIHLSGYLIGHWPALTGRLTPFIFLLGFSLQFAGAAYDKLSRQRIHPLFLWVPFLEIVETVAVLTILMPSAGWRRLAMWLAG